MQLNDLRTEITKDWFNRQPVRIQNLITALVIGLILIIGPLLLEIYRTVNK